MKFHVESTDIHVHETMKWQNARKFFVERETQQMTADQRLWVNDSYAWFTLHCIQQQQNICEGKNTHRNKCSFLVPHKTVSLFYSFFTLLSLLLGIAFTFTGTLVSCFPHYVSIHHAYTIYR